MLLSLLAKLATAVAVFIYSCIDDMNYDRFYISELRITKVMQQSADLLS